MKLFILFAAIVSMSAQAHFQIGTYKGVTLEGADCEVKFESVSFSTPFKNPLSERVTVSALNKTFVLQHTAKIDDASVLYNEEFLESVIPFQGGAEFFKVAMVESDVKEGPDSFVHMTHDWKKNQFVKVTCEKLVFQGE